MAENFQVDAILSNAGVETSIQSASNGKSRGNDIVPMKLITISMAQYFSNLSDLQSVRVFINPH